MPSVRVPLKGERGWDELMIQRKEFWRKPGHDRLTPHFKASEFYTHDGTPCPIVSRPALVKLCKDYLEPLRKKFGTCFVLSGYRHQLYNAGIGGVPNSQHVYEHTFESVAADIRFEKGTPSAWGAAAKAIRKTLGNKGGIGIYVRQGFVHVDNRPYMADWTGKGE